MSTIKADNFTWKSGESSGQAQYTVGADKVVWGTMKSWCNFNGSGTVSVRQSFNVSSLTDHATAQWYPNFTVAMIDVNYATSGSAGSTTNDGGNYEAYIWNKSASSVWVRGGWQGTGYDLDWMTVMVIR